MIKIMTISFILGFLILFNSLVKKDNILKSKFQNNFKSKRVYRKFADFLNKHINQNSVSNKKLNSKIQKLGYSINLGDLKIFKFLVFIFVFMISINFYIASKNLIVKNKLTLNTMYSELNLNITLDEFSTISDEINLNYKEYLKNNNEVGLAKYINQTTAHKSFDLTSNDLKQTTEYYINVYNIATLNYKIILIVLVLSLASTGLVDLVLDTIYKINYNNIIAEFENLEAIAILLLCKNDMNVLNILNLMCDNAKYLKKPLLKCINSYNINPKAALDKLVNDIGNSDFKDFMVLIKNCLDKPKSINSELIKIQRDLRTMLEKTQSKGRYRKKSCRLTILHIPMMLLICLNMLFPMIIEAIAKM